MTRVFSEPHRSATCDEGRKRKRGEQLNWLSHTLMAAHVMPVSLGQCFAINRASAHGPVTRAMTGVHSLFLHPWNAFNYFGLAIALPSWIWLKAR